MAAHDAAADNSLRRAADMHTAQGSDQIPPLAKCRVGPSHPLLSLLDFLRGLRGSLECSRATELLGGLMCALLDLHPELQTAFSGRWDPRRQCFTDHVEVQRLWDDLARYRFMRDYHKKAGKGATGTVYLSRDLVDGKEIAVKVVPDALDENGIKAGVLAELFVVNALPSHPNIMRVDSACVIGDKAYLVMARMHTDLERFLRVHRYLSARDAKRIVYYILRALAHMHEHGFVHSDVKPANVLLSQDGKDIRLSDFNLSFWDNCQPASRQMQTPFYRAIEVCDSLHSQLVEPQSQDEFIPVGPEMDIWSVGAVFVELLNGRPLLADAREVKEYQNYYLMKEMVARLGCHERYEPAFGRCAACVHGGRTPPCHLAQVVPALAHDPSGLELLAALLDQEVDTRITAQAAMHHPYFADMMDTPTEVESCVSVPGRRKVVGPAAVGNSTRQDDQHLEAAKRRRMNDGVERQCRVDAGVIPL